MQRMIGRTKARAALAVLLMLATGGTLTTSDVTDASAVKAEFVKLSAAPVRAIIYTHSHPDHTGGATVFAVNDHPEIYSHQLFVDRVPDVGRGGRAESVCGAIFAVFQ